MLNQPVTGPKSHVEQLTGCTVPLSLVTISTRVSNLGQARRVGRDSFSLGLNSS